MIFGERRWINSLDKEYLFCVLVLGRIESSRLSKPMAGVCDKRVNASILNYIT